MQANIVIVGAGLAGAATAYHLKRLGVSDVLVLEQEDAPGQHATAHNAAIVREIVEDVDVQQLASAGARVLRRGELAPFRRTGGFLIGPGTQDVGDHFPGAKGNGRWCPDDGVTDPAGLLQSYLRGQCVQCETRVLGWKADDNGIHVQTSRGLIDAQMLVNAAGPWAGRVGKLDLAPFNRHLFLTPTMPEIGATLPYVWDITHGLYFRPESGGLLLCPCDESHRAPGDYRVDPDVQEMLARLLAEHQPQLANVAVRQAWTGQRTFARDRKFVIGFDPRCTRLFHVAALGGHGVTTSYAVGQMAAKQIAADTLAVDNPFDPARLSPADLKTIRFNPVRI